jgi:signal transduction histidine kinase
MEPSRADYPPSPIAHARGLGFATPDSIMIEAADAVKVSMGPGRVKSVANLFDNEIAHLPPGCRIHVSVAGGNGQADLKL